VQVSVTPPLRFALCGTGFWARFQLAAWRDVPGAECIAVFNRTRAKGDAFAQEFRIPAVYDNLEAMLRSESLDFVDVCTHPSSFAEMVRRIALFRIPIITQKPMAPSLAVAEENIRICRAARIPYLIHENWRWQAQLRELKAVLARGEIGTPFRARIAMVSSFPVFINEPQIKELEEFILTDMGTHILDVARFFFGEAERLYCQTHRVHADIKGEDIATVVLSMGGGKTTVVCELGYPETPVENDYFPETLVSVEGDRGTAEVTRNYWLRVTTKAGTQSRQIAPVPHAWDDPAYRVVHASIGPCNTNLLRALRDEGAAETTAEDNYQTLRLVFAAYESARTGQAVRL
jgi:predicted dehydrogenase